jgi:hypothetical protein
MKRIAFTLMTIIFYNHLSAQKLPDSTGLPWMEKQRQKGSARRTSQEHMNTISPLVPFMPFICFPIIIRHR